MEDEVETEDEEGAEDEEEAGVYRKVGKRGCVTSQQAGGREAREESDGGWRRDELDSGTSRR